MSLSQAEANSLACTIHADQLRQLLNHQLTLSEQHPAGAANQAPLMIWGPPGVGKSSIIRAVCQQQQVDFLDIRLSQREPVDLRGLPVPKADHVDWLLSGEWPRDPASRGIVLFDELPAADRSLQVAAYEIILDRRLGDLYQLPPGWLIVAAGNRPTDQAVAHGFSSALANRFCHLELTAEAETWVRWAHQQNLAPEVIAFVRYQPQRLFDQRGTTERGWPTPRSWHRVSQVLQQADGLPESLIQAQVHGLVGDGAAIEFLAFRRQHTELPDVASILAGQTPIEVPESPDLLFAFCTSLVQHLWPRQQQAAEVSDHRLQRFFDVMAAMSSDFATMTLTDALNHDLNHDLDQEHTRQARAERLLGHPGFTGWTEQHGIPQAVQEAVHG